jgi:nucleoside-diphosphate-sugar epimerase
MSVADRILVTGATGFLGSHIVARARLQGRDTIATSRAARAGITPLDVHDSTSLAMTMSALRPTIVVNCAAYGVNYAEQDFEAALGVNVHGALRLLEVAAECGARRFVHIGSCSEYGSKLGRISEDAGLAPTASYGATKAAATILLMERARDLGLQLIVARAFGMWGPREAGYRLVPQIIAACLSRSRLALTPCDVIRDYTYVEDMADDILALAVHPELPPQAVINVGSGESVVLREFVLKIAGLLDGEHLMDFDALPHRPTEMPSLVANVARLQGALGRRPRTAIEDGIERMVGHAVRPAPK